MRAIYCFLGLLIAGGVWWCSANAPKDLPVKERKAGEKEIAVFVALCDNVNQGIAPVPEKIGKGDDPERNLYWGCSDGLPQVFKKSPHWKENASHKYEEGDILRKKVYQRTNDQNVILTAKAYRGDAMRACLTDFEKAAASGEYELVAFIGHNGFMDYQPEAAPSVKREGRKTVAIVLCCKSRDYFETRLQSMNCKPVLMTKQNMYPGAFILHDALEEFLKGKDLKSIKQAAAKGYAKNQKISVKAASGIFADL